MATGLGGYVPTNNTITGLSATVTILGTQYKIPITVVPPVSGTGSTWLNNAQQLAQITEQFIIKVNSTIPGQISTLQNQVNSAISRLPPVGTNFSMLNALTNQKVWLRLTSFSNDTFWNHLGGLNLNYQKILDLINIPNLSGRLLPSGFNLNTLNQLIGIDFTRVKSVFTTYYSNLYNYLTTLHSQLTAILDQAKQFPAAVKAKIQAMIDQVRTAIDATVAKLQTYVNQIVAQIRAQVDTIQRAYSNFANNISGIWNSGRRFNYGSLSVYAVGIPNHVNAYNNAANSKYSINTLALTSLPGMAGQLLLQQERAKSDQAYMAFLMDWMTGSIKAAFGG